MESRQHDPTSSMTTHRGGSRKLDAPKRPHRARSDINETFAALHRSSSSIHGGPARAPLGASAAAAGGSAGSRPPRCGCLRRRGAGSTPGFQQTFVVLRHSERRDYVDPTYKTSEEGLAWPHDTPLTKEGVELAKAVAEELYALHQTAQFATVACSPYRRCMETAAEVARRLQLPVVIDQEIGEVRDRTMPEGHTAHRSPIELKEMAKELKLMLVNPELEDGSIKIFGQVPAWPETLEDAKNRYVVRMETYIRKSAEEQQNMILVTHADAVVAALMMFERGGADVQNMGFCARVIATREVKEGSKAVGHGVFAEQWAVKCAALGAEIIKEEGAMSRYYEKLYLEKCEETQEMVAKRKDKRTKTDSLFDSALKDLGGVRKFGAAAADSDEEEEEEEGEEAKGAAQGDDSRV